VSYDPLTHSRHNAGDRSAKVGHEIKEFIHSKSSKLNYIDQSVNSVAVKGSEEVAKVSYIHSTTHVVDDIADKKTNGTWLRRFDANNRFKKGLLDRPAVWREYADDYLPPGKNIQMQTTC